MTRSKPFPVVHSARNLFQPINIVPRSAKIKKELITKSQKLMTDIGIIRQGSNGIFHLLPLGLRALDKLIKLVDNHMNSLSAQKLQLPILTEGNLWKKSGRWDTTGLELFKLKDRHSRDYILSPTHEESIADLMSTIPDVTSNKLPILLYQITTKFRDEVKPRCGLLRAREFLMKDLYSFDKSLFDAKITYNNICSTYDRIFENLNIPYLKVVGETGDMGGILSHEYHIPSDIGEDTLAVCEECNNASNSKLYQSDFCSVCNNKMKLVRSIEVGHTFLLGKRYSAPLQATFKNTDNSVVPLVMGSYGLGLTRILAACVEVLSPKENIKWPLLIAPYSVVIITPKAGSHGAYSCGDLGNQIYSRLNCMQHLSEDVLLDDRDNLTIGKRVWHARRTGYPYLIVIGEKATLQPPTVELLDVAHDSVKYLSYPDLIQFFNEHFDSLDQNISYQIS